MTAKSVPMASLYLITSLAISLATISLLSGVSPLAAVIRAAMAFVFFSIIGWGALLTLRPSELETVGQKDDEENLGANIDISIGPDEGEEREAGNGEQMVSAVESKE